MKFKNSVNNVIRKFGYQISKAPFSQQEISSGKYRWLEEASIDIIIDVGANEGQFIDKISGILPGKRIIAFEPLHDTYQRLVRRLSANKNIRIYNCALGDRETETVINRNEYSPSSSLLELTDLHKKAFPETAQIEKENITVRILDNILADQLPANILLKIDVQGYELQVLRGAEKTLASAGIIILETSFFELYNGQPLFRDVFNYLTERKFLFGGCFEQLYDERNGQILQADSIFFKEGVLS